MSNLDKLIKDEYTILDSFRALYINGANNLWATIKSGNKLRDLRSEALQDGLITPEEEPDIKSAERDFYYNFVSFHRCTVECQTGLSYV